jgi:hypothetical protein
MDVRSSLVIAVHVERRFNFGLRQKQCFLNSTRELHVNVLEGARELRVQQVIIAFTLQNANVFQLL